MTRAILVVLALLLAAPAIAFDSPWPEEAERYDAEHILDVLTMRRDREWRDLWFARDNDFYMGFGSLNVELWRFDQRLKLAAPIDDRWRVRFRMERLDGLDPVSRDRHELELEFRAAGPWYASLLLDLAALKRENDVGFALQRRTAVDRFVTLAVRVRDAANDYAMRHGDLIEGEERLYAAQPVEVALTGREELGERVRVGIDARATNEWELGIRPVDAAGEHRTEWGSERDLAAWIEWDAAERVAIDLDLRLAEYLWRLDEAGERQEDRLRTRSFIPRLRWNPRGFYDILLVAGAEVRRERWAGSGPKAGDLRKDAVLPFLTARVPITESVLVETGWLGERYESRRTGTAARTDDRWENRLLLSVELRRGERHRLRLVETIDLDREDWGQYGVHDHFFLMTNIAF